MEAGQIGGRQALLQEKLALQVRLQHANFTAECNRQLARELDAASAAVENASVRFGMLRAGCQKLDLANALERQAFGFSRRIATIERELAGDLPVPMPREVVPVVLSAEQAAAMDETMGAAV